MNYSLSQNEGLVIDRNECPYIHDFTKTDCEKEFNFYIASKPDTQQYCSYIRLWNFQATSHTLTFNVHVSEEEDYYGPFQYDFTIIWDASNNTYDIKAYNLGNINTTCVKDSRYDEGWYDVEKLIPVLFRNCPNYSKDNLN